FAAAAGQSTAVEFGTSNGNVRVAGSPASFVVDPSVTIRGRGDIDDWFAAAATVTNLGLISADQGGSLDIQVVTFTNTATVEAVGSEVTISSLPSNFSGGTLSGGSWQARTGGAITVANAGAATAVLDAGVLIEGAGASIEIGGGPSMFAGLSSITATGTLEVTGGATLTTSSALVNDGSLTVGASSTLTAPSLTNNGNLTLGGAIAADLTNTGTLAPGASPGLATVGGDLVLDPAGTLEIEIEGTTAGTDFDRITASGNVTVDGTLAITSPFSPATSDIFEIVAAGGTRTGTFATVTGNDLGDGRFYVPTYDTQTVTLTVQSPSALSVGDVTVDEEAGLATFTVVAEPPLGNSATVEYATGSGTATSDVDFTATADTLSFDSGDNAKTVDVPILDDGIWEGDETFTFTLSNPSGALIGDGSAVGTITEDEPFPSVTWALGSASTGEADVTVPIEAVLDPPSAFGVTVDYAVTGGTASAGTDYEAIPADTFTFAPGATSQTLMLTIFDDTVGEDDETVRIGLSNASGATLMSPITHVHTIVDDDPKVSFSSGSTTVDESAGVVQVEVVLSQPVADIVTVDFARTGGSASTADYAFTPGTVTFDPGDTSETFTVTVLEDNIDEPNENIFLALSNAVNATVFSPSAHTFTITDNDPPPAVSFDATESSVGEADGSVTVDFTLANPSWRTVTVNVDATGGTATGDTDYTPTSWSIPVPAGDLAGSLTVEILDDDDNNPDLTVELTITSVTFGQVGAPSVHTITIIDDEEPCILVLSAQISTDTGPGPEELALGAGPLLAWGGVRRSDPNRAERRRRHHVGIRSGRGAATLLALLLAAAIASGAAASLGASSVDLGSGSTEVPGCDPDGVSVTYNLDPADFRLIDEVVVHDLHPSLTGHRLYVRVGDSGGLPLAGGSGSTIFDGSASVAVDIPGCAAADAASVTVTVNEEAP
ncbi:MAG TPA: Calx-beta domain-containing protein, partial [Acidimicrobiales bacterium]